MASFGFWLNAFGFWLHAFGIWLDAFGLWLKASGFWLNAWLWLGLLHAVACFKGGLLKVLVRFVF